MSFNTVSKDRIRHWLNEIWPKAIQEMPEVVRVDLVATIERGGLEEAQLQSLLLAHRREDRNAAKAPNTEALSKRLAAMRKDNGEKRTRKVVEDRQQAPDVDPDAGPNARLRTILEDLDDAGIRQVIAKGARLAPALVGSGGPILNAAERARTVMKKPVTADDILNNQHLRVLAKHGVGLMEKTKGKA